MFLAPFEGETPVEKLKYGGQRRMVDQADRDFELVSYNQHPSQLLMYEVNNEELQKQNENAELASNGQTPLEEQMLDNFLERVQAEQEENDGQKISYDRWSELLADAVRQYNAELNRPGTTTNENGEFDDFLEVRRPFMGPNNDGVTH
jgi:hypothetical protein